MTRVCSICARPESSANRVEAAHIVAKGAGGDPAGLRTDTALLCAGTGGNTDRNSCHGANHDGQLALRRTPEGVLQYRAGEQYAKVLNKRRVRCKEGQWHTARFEGHDPDTVDEPMDAEDPDDLAIIEAQVAEAYAALTSAAGSSWRDIAEAVIEHERLCIERLGKREGRTRARQWRHESRISDATASNMRSVVRYIPAGACREVSQAVQVSLAKAIKEAVMPIPELVTYANVLAKSDFDALCWPKSEPVPTPRVDCPLGLACAHPMGEAS